MSMLKAIEIVHKHTPVIQYKKGFQPIKDIEYSNESFADIAFIPLGFQPGAYYELAESCETEYVLQEIRSTGESGLPLFDEKGKICGILSKSTSNGVLYTGVSVNDIK